MVNLGDEVRCMITGFSGIAVASHEYLNGCMRITVQPKVSKDGKLPEPQTFDEPHLEVKKANKVPPGNRLTGGPKKYMPRARRRAE